MRHYDCIILGGGAAGLTACAVLAKKGLHVALIDQLDRVGKKLLATGNGRCNLSNEDMDPAFYGEAAGFVQRVYEKTPAQEVLSFFESLGLMTVSEEGRIYPRTMTASSVLDVLRFSIDSSRVHVMTGQRVSSIAPSRQMGNGFSVGLSCGMGLFAPWVLCAMGGCAAPSMGSDGSGLALLESMGHRITDLSPALVQLRCDHRALKSLKGVRVQAALTLLVDGKPAAEETGELLFADYGVSGVCVFQLSRHVEAALREKHSVCLRVNLLPEVPAHDVPAWLASRILLFGEMTADKLFTGVFHRLLSQALLRQAEIPLDQTVCSLSPAQREALSRCITAFTLPVTGTNGFTHAQVTRGGVCLEDVDPDTLSSRLYDGLYILGEMLDVDGPCGGYNLHFAFASALTACKDIDKQLIF